MLSTWRRRAARGRRQQLRLDNGTRQYFKKILSRERARSDRSGTSFALITCQANPIRGAQISLQDLAQILKREARDVDEVGLLDRHRLGLVLPDTDRIGALILADRAVQRLQTKGVAVEFEIFVYPSQLPPIRKDADDENRRDNNDDGTRNLEPEFAAPLPAWKRLIDVGGALVLGIASLPILLIAGIAIKCSSRGPMFFVQEREGLGGRRFRMWKLRTMCIDAEDMQLELRQFSQQDGPAFKMQNDPRTTRVGRLLRATSIDELPQLWNVLKGDMSLVGPRPLPCHESAACNPWQRRRLDVTPGLTCIWQVKGRSSVSFDEWMRMDQQYVRSRSVSLDLFLLLFTVPAVIMRRGAR